jgi:hypothetical protein
MKKKDGLIKEKELLVLCVRHDLCGDGAGRIRELAGQYMDWEAFLRLSALHKVFPLVRSTLDKICRDSVPQDILGRLSLWCLGNGARNALLCRQLENVTDLLEREGIPSVSFKGPVLAAMAYGDVSLRIFSDLDILVSKGDALKTRDLLSQIGFRPDLDLPFGMAGAYLEHENFFRLTGNDGVTVIDLHWELTGKYSAVPLFLEDVKTHLTDFRLSGKTVKSLGREILLLYLCVHNASHGWDNLEFPASMAGLIKRHGGFDGRKLIRLSEKIRAVRMTLSGLYVVERLFGIRLPSSVKDAIIRDRFVAVTGERIIKKLMEPDGTETALPWSWRFGASHLRTRDSYSDALVHGLRLIFRPTVKEWIHFPSTPRMTLYYPVLRPVRLALELFKALIR